MTKNLEGRWGGDVIWGILRLLQVPEWLRGTVESSRNGQVRPLSFAPVSLWVFVLLSESFVLTHCIQHKNLQLTLVICKMLQHILLLTTRMFKFNELILVLPDSKRSFIDAHSWVIRSLMLYFYYMHCLLLYLFHTAIISTVCSHCQLFGWLFIS